MNLVNKIKSKPELQGLADSVIQEALSNYLKKNALLIDNLSDKSVKLIVKDVRKELRLMTGRFQVTQKKRTNSLNNDDVSEILKMHSSTKERIDFYPSLREKIAKLKAKSILDLGCGLNPLALSSKESKYLASDINQSELDLINKFFIKKGIQGKVLAYDLRKFNEADFEYADLCLIFKVLDIIEKKSHKLAERIITGLKCKSILISFATIRLSGRPMNFPRRLWLEALLKRLRLNYETFSSRNEIFYLINKSSSE